jgi:hypothetical protein
MKTVVFGCHTSKGGMAHFQADFNGSELSNIRSHVSGRLLNIKPLQVSFCPDTQYLEADYNCETGLISDLQVYRKRTTAERQQNVFLIASQVQTIFKK